MTSKERMLRALHREKPDRLPVTIHQWQQYHLDTCLPGLDALAAFKVTGMDAAIQYFEAMGQFWIPNAEKYIVQAPDWQEDVQVINSNPQKRIVHHTIRTPGGVLTYKTESDLTTTWITEYLVKRPKDIELIDKYMPVARLNKTKVAAAYDAVGDAGILRGFVWGDQAGCWQHACCLREPEQLILEAMDNPAEVHRLLKILLKKKLQFIDESLGGTWFDLIETGGGAGSDTVISPNLHREFCLPYDREIHRAVQAVGLKTTYHTCGGMRHLLDQIVANGTDASETLAPPGVGGNITQLDEVRQAFAGKVAMIGGMDQFNILTRGTKAEIGAEVFRLFRGFGRDGGYILSASDHFFDAPVENLRAYAEAAWECAY
jgi:hypothetical protein